MRGMQLVNGRPGDLRGFIHKKLLGGVIGAATGFITGGPKGILKGAATGFQAVSSASPGRFPSAQFQPSPMGPRSLSIPAWQRGESRATSEARFSEQRQMGSGGCPPGFQWDGRDCKPLRTRKTPGLKGFTERAIPFGETGFQEFGEATMGRFGAGMEPGIRSMDTRVCPRGAVLGQDGLCYNRRDLRNSERFWPRGRRPLLTGGDMRCISVASAAAKKLQRKQKQLEDLGMLKKPARRRAAPALPPGHHAHVAHS